ncbi:MAG: cobalamin-binding protein [Gemmatimonadota bacterium]
MGRRWVLLALAVAALGGPAAWAVPRQAVDDLGTEVGLSAPPQRIVSLAPSNTELLFALGLGSWVVGVTSYCDYPPAAARVARVAGFSDLSVETIAAVQPDLVLASRGNDPEGLRAVAELGVPVFAIDVQTVAQLMEAITRVGYLTWREAAAAALRDSLEARVEAVVARCPAGRRPRVMWGSFADPIFTAGAGTLIDDVIRLAGGENLGARAPGAWPQISLETIVAWQPEVFISSLMEPGQPPESRLEALRQMDGWRAVPAVRHGRVHYVDGDLLNRPGPRIVEALERVAELVHPAVGQD